MIFIVRISVYIYFLSVQKVFLICMFKCFLNINITIYTSQYLKDFIKINIVVTNKQINYKKL